MAKTVTGILLIISVVLQGCYGILSSGLEDGANLYVCQGNNLTLSWDVTAESGERINDMKWLYTGQSDQLMAVFTLNTFLPTPSYSSRVHYLSNGALILTNVNEGDAGNYTLEVTLTGGEVRRELTATVHVATATTAEMDATLSLTKQPVPVYDDASGEYHMELMCASQGRQPPSVIWMTPDGQETVSSYHNGHVFNYMIPNPVVSGNYTCKLPPEAPAVVCLPPGSPVVEGTSVYVNDMESRVAVLEAENSRLRQRLGTLEMRQSSRDNSNGCLVGVEQIITVLPSKE